MLSRRRALQTVLAAGAVATAGCTADERQGVTESAITPSEGSCVGESRATVAVDDDRRRIEVEGVVPAETVCTPLRLSVLTTRDEASRGHVILEIDSRNEPTTDCESCDDTAFVPYTGSVETVDPITAIRVLHLWGADQSDIAVSRTVG